MAVVLLFSFQNGLLHAERAHSHAAAAENSVRNGARTALVLRGVFMGLLF